MLTAVGQDDTQGGPRVTLLLLGLPFGARRQLQEVLTAERQRAARVRSVAGRGPGGEWIPIRAWDSMKWLIAQAILKRS